MTTDKLLRRTESPALKASFLYVSDAEVSGDKKNEWLAFIEKTAKEAAPDFVFFANAETAKQANICCRKVTVDEAPLTVAVNGIKYAVIGKEFPANESAKAFVYGSCKHDYAIEEKGVWYMNTAASEKGGIRRVCVTDDGEVLSTLLYFADKREQVFKANWKTELFGRGTQGRPMTDAEGVYVPTADDGAPKQCGVYKLDARGGIVWKCPTENSINCDLAQTEDTVMGVDCEGTVYFICKDCGKLLGKIKLSYNGRYAKAATAYYGNIAYVSLKGSVYAIDVKEQKIIWTYVGEGCKTQAPVVAGKLILCSGESGFYALCAKSGQKVWENGSIKSCARALPLVSGRILLPADDCVLLLDGETGAVLAEKKIKGVCLNVPCQPLLRGGRVYLGTKGRGVISVDMSDVIRAEAPEKTSEAEIEASYPLNKENKTVAGDIMYLDGHIVYSTTDGSTYMTNISNGENKKCLNTLSAISAAPSFVRVKKVGRNAMEGYIVTSTLSGRIFGNRL